MIDKLRGDHEGASRSQPRQRWDIVKATENILESNTEPLTEIRNL